jgi:L-threonylcarbamoyladenylate synthase
MILYPTETMYGLGVNAFNAEALARLFELKGRDAAKSVSWLVSDVEEIGKYGMWTSKAREIAKKHLPWPLTLILKAHDHIPNGVLQNNRTIGFRVSSDSVAGALASECTFPLTATSANISGLPTLPIPEAILAQFGDKTHLITRVIDDGPRSGTPSTVVRCVGDGCEVVRKGGVEVSCG